MATGSAESRVVFSGGAAVEIAMPAQDVRSRLGEDKNTGEPFTVLNTDNGEVFVASSQVAYIQPLAAKAKTVSFGSVSGH